jgi:hypothetical protein
VIPETTPELPEGWEITTVEITESTTFRVAVAHPRDASSRAIAAVGHDDLAQEEHPEAVFPHELGEDSVTARGEDQDTWGWPPWAGSRPGHATVTAILAATSEEAA